MTYESRAKSSAHPRNLILAALPSADYMRLRPHLTSRTFLVKETVHPVDAAVETVFFPEGGVFSVTSVQDDGRMVEGSTIGREGLLDRGAA